MSIDRRSLFTAGAGALLATRALAQTAPEAPVGLTTHPTYGPGAGALPYSQNEIVHQASNFFGAATQDVSAIVEKAFRDNGEPTGYIVGNEGSGGFVVGLRYGSGELYMRSRPRTRVFWRGPSAGFDFGGDLSRVFVLCYGLQNPNELFRRFPGVQGSIYLVGGLGLTYQRADGITLAPIRTGVGARVNASVGVIEYSRHKKLNPF